MTPIDLTVLMTALLVAAAVGTGVAVICLSHRSLLRSDRRLRLGAALMAIPALGLGWALSHPDLAITSVRSETIRATAEQTSVADARRAPRPVAGRELEPSTDRPASSWSRPSTQPPSEPRSSEPPVSEVDSPGQGGSPPEPPGGTSPPPPTETASPPPSPPPTESPPPDTDEDVDEEEEDGGEEEENGNGNGNGKDKDKDNNNGKHAALG